MADAVIKTINCLEIPYLVLALVAAAVSFLLSKKICIVFFLSVLIALAWRSFFHITSSRYCSFFLIIVLLFVCFFSRTTLRKVHFAGFFCLCSIVASAGLFTFNIYKLFSPFKNTFIFDIQQTVNHITTAYDTPIIIIDGKEWDRIRGPEKQEYRQRIKLNWETNFKEAFEKIREYSLWNGKVFLVLAENSDSFFGDPKDDVPSDESMRKIQEFKKNKNKTKVFSIYSYSPNGLTQYDPVDGLYHYGDKDNFIKNGNIETIQESSVKRRRLENIISAGIVFYDRDDTVLPENEIILDTWSSDISEATFPKVYADSKNVINGKYSLNVKFEDNSKVQVFLLNKFSSVPGKLRFLIKRLQGDIMIRISRWDFSNSRGVPVHDSDYYLNLPDDKTYLVTIPLKETDFTGTDKKSLFYLTGNNVNVLIDDISYIPEQHNSPKAHNE